MNLVQLHIQKEKGKKKRNQSSKQKKKKTKQKTPNKQIKKTNKQTNLQGRNLSLTPKNKKFKKGILPKENTAEPSSE